MKNDADLINFLKLSLGNVTDMYLRALAQIVNQSRNVSLGEAPFLNSSNNGLNKKPQPRPQPREIIQDGGDYPELVVLPAGSFKMGSNEYPNEQPVHTVCIGEFAIGKYPVTQAQWMTVMGSNPSYFKGDDRLPVENVSWNDAQAFIHKLNQLTGQTYYLPSEAESEYACRAGSAGAYCFSGDKSQLAQYAWYVQNSSDKTHPVGEKRPNAFGLHDMHGNVWEWCEDVWHVNYQEAPADGSAWIDEGSQECRVLRGSSWADESMYLRSSNRNANVIDTKYGNIGFRVARVLS
jgi:formylglycine-generating enzyme required for sulfatase activity